MYEYPFGKSLQDRRWFSGPNEEPVEEADIASSLMSNEMLLAF